MAVATDTPREVYVEHVMGTAVSVTVPAPVVAERAVSEFFAWLRHVDEDFSTYRADSLVSRVRREALRPSDAGPEFAEVMELCDRARDISHGAFDAWHHSREGLDPSGLVKGWALEKGAEILRVAGTRSFCVNGGGDVIADGESRPGRPWHVGIRHPWDPAALAAVIRVTDLAVATSALYERGAHIRDPRNGRVPGELASVTVVGPSLTWADTYATAAFVMGGAGVAWVDSLPGYEALAVTMSGGVLQTPGFRRFRD